MEMDIREICIQEIALEGLEGITIPALWLRLENREPKLPYTLTNVLKRFLWKFVVQHGSLEIFRIPEPRNEPAIFDRFKDSEMACVPVTSAPDELETLVEIYSSDAVDDVAGIRGACSNYHQRENVTEEIRKLSKDLAQSMEAYGANRLVVVASQGLREKEFLVGNMTAQVIGELNDVCYCVLERVARARWQGELQARLNKLSFCKKTYHIHYIVNKLHRLGLVAKTNHTYRRADKNNRPIFQILVTLKKFERDCVTFSSRTITNFTEMLRNAPCQTMNLGEIRERLNISNKAFKTTYKALEKSGDIVIHPIKTERKDHSISSKEASLVEKQDVEMDEDDEEADVQAIFSKTSASAKPLVLERPLLYQAYEFILHNGTKGVAQRDMLCHFKGFGRLEARNLCKMLYKKNLVDIVLIDEGKQRTQTYIPKNCSSASLKCMEFTDQKKQMQQLLVETTMLQPDGATVTDLQNPQQAISTQQDKGKSKGKGKQHKHNKGKETAENPTVETSIVEHASSSGVTKLNSKALALSSILRDQQMTPEAIFHAKKWDANLTTRKIKRHNVILKQLNQEKLIEGYKTVQKILGAVEVKEGVTTKIDKKTVVRLIDKMSNDGVLKHVVIPVTHNERTEDFHFIMALDCPPSLLKSALDQAKFRLAGEEENRAARLEQKKVEEGRKERKKMMKEMNDLQDYSSPVSSGSKRKLTLKFFQPKFKRLRALHQYMWYLAYGHPDISNETFDKDIVDPDSIKEYDTKSTWKKYLPPAPIHIHNGLRWLQVGDLAVILPLSILCQFQRVMHKTEELEYWLVDENKRHTLVRHLPPDIKSVLLHKRRYMFALTACIEQLSFMGLVSVTRGRQFYNSNMPRENMMIYVHRHATVFDTRTSCDQHIKVEDKQYEKLCYVFDEFQDLENYWYKLQSVCMQTRLGFVEYQDPGYEMIRDHLGHCELKKFVNNTSDTQFGPNDDGHIPGDQRGAGGLDSSMFSYLYRNWELKLVSLHDPGSPGSSDNAFQSSNRLPKLRAKNLTLNPRRKKPVSSNNELALISVDQVEVSEKFHENTQKKDFRKRGGNSCKAVSEKKLRIDSNAGKKAGKAKEKNKRPSSLLQNGSTAQRKETDPEIVFVDNVGRNDRVKGGRGVKRKVSASDSGPLVTQTANEILGVGVVKRQRKTRKPKGTNCQNKKRGKYVDKRDREAIKARKGRLRVNFTAAEDSLYLLCHITTSVLIQLYWKKPYGPRKQIIPWSIIRDIAYDDLPESVDKTSHSVGRRTFAIMNSHETRICHDISVADIISDKKFLKKFFPSELDLDGDPEKFSGIYRNFVHQLRKRFKVQPGLFIDEIPDTNEKLLATYTPNTILRKPNHIQEKRCHFHDNVASTVDIKKSVAENMIYIALTMPDSEYSIYQAYRAFEEYPEQILSEVFTTMKVSGFVCSKKNTPRKVPFAICAYRLSHAHILSLRAPIRSHVIDQVSKNLKLTSDIRIDSEAELEAVLLISYFFAQEPVDLNIQIPEQVILPETPKTAAFENQFIELLKNVKQNMMKDAEEYQGKVDGSGSVPPDSLMAAAACMLKENLDDAHEDPDPEQSPDAEKDPDARVKLAEIMKLYNRHPSYSNWLMLINPGKRSESKFANLNYALSSDCIVLSPCVITLKDTVSLIKKRSEPKCRNMTSQPVDRINELLDSIKVDFDSSTSKWEQHQVRRMDAQSFVMRAVFDAIDKSSFVGTSKSELLDSVTFDWFTVNSALQKLMKNDLVYSVGIKETKYVAYKHIEPWTAKGFRFCANEDFGKEILYELKLFQRANESDARKTKKNVNEAVAEISTSRGLEDETASDIPAASDRVMDRYKEMKFLCRPWHTLFGGISFANAKSLLLSVFLKIYSSPGITKEKICALYSYQPACISELLNILQEANCITRQSVEYPGKKRLFGLQSPTKMIDYYEATLDGLIIISQWVDFANGKIPANSQPTEPEPASQNAG